MRPVEGEPKIVVADTDKGFDYWLSKDNLSEETRSALRKCAVLIVPSEGWGDHTGPVFADNTLQLLDCLKTELPTELVADVCSEDDDYREIALYSDKLRLGELLVTHFALPTVVSVLGTWIAGKLLKRGVSVSVTLTAERDEKGVKRATSITYEGPASEMTRHLGSALRDMRGRGASNVDPEYPAEPKE